MIPPGSEVSISMKDLHFQITSKDLGLIGPLLIIIATACFVLILDLFSRDREKIWSFYLTAFGLVVAFIYNVFLGGQKLGKPFDGLLNVDTFSLIFNGLIFLSAILTVFLSLSYMRRTGTMLAEYYVMILAVVMGMSVIAMSADLMMIFLGVELLSIPLYVLAAFLRERRSSVEAGLKYFLLGAFASGFLLYGIVLLYGATGSTRIALVVAHTLQAPPSGLLLGGFALIAIGLAFKIAAVPFHMWAPDVYEGSPTPITAFMATGVKIAGFAAIIRIFAHVTPPASSTLASGTAVLAFLTMLVGNLGALTQTNIKRLLAFSSVAHAGYLLVGLSAGLSSGSQEAYRAITFYLAAYTFMNVGAFGIVIFLNFRGEECNEIDDMSGLSRKHPGLALAMAIFMFTLAGLPPSAGFFGKFYLFKAAVDAGLIWLAVAAVILAVVSLYYYLKVITTMYLRPPKEETPEAEYCPYLVAVTMISVIGIFVLGLIPKWGLGLLDSVQWSW